jgi:hypothetical protein
MARYEHLPIYRKAMELSVYLEQVVRQFPRFHKYGIGARLRETSWDLLGLIIRVNNLPLARRAPVVARLRDRVEDLNTGLSIAKELQAFANFNSYRHAAMLAVNLGRQSEGWLKSAAAASSPES